MRIHQSRSLLINVPCTALSVLLLAAPAPSGATETPKARGFQRERVSLILINAVVTDRQGHPVSDLRRDDFTLLVDGHQVPLESVDVQHSSDSQDPLSERSTRRFVFLFNGLINTKSSALGSNSGATQAANLAAIQAARSFLLGSLSAGDEAMVAGLGLKLKTYQEFTGERAKLLAALDAVATDPQLFAGRESSVSSGG
jgi:hypothetical protein